MDTMATPTVKVHRHLIRGLLGGLALGLGLALLTLTYAKAPFGTLTPWIGIGAGVVAGILIGALGPVRHARRLR